MAVTGNSRPEENRFIPRLLSAAGGAILAGSLGVVIFGLFRESIPNEIVAVIAGAAGGLVAILQRRWSKQARRGESE